MPFLFQSGISFLRTVIVLFVLMVTFVILQNVSGTSNTPLLIPLDRFPTQLDQWKLVATRSSTSEVIDLLGVDDYIDYSYTDTKDRLVNLYVGFYKSVSGGRGYHSPKNCIPGGGWGIDSVATVVVKPVNRSGSSVEITEMIIRNHNEYQVVLYWYQNRGRIIASEYWEKIYLVLDALFMRRRDGAFVRLMANAPNGDIKSAEALLIKFAAISMSELDQYLPGKFL